MQVIAKIQDRLKRVSLSPIARAVLADKLTYLSVDKLKRIEAAIERTRGVRGDLVEFGVALGGSGIILAHHAGPGRRFIGLDVFGMIPPPTSDKDDAKSKERYAVIKSGQSEGIGGSTYYGYRQDLLSDVKASFSRHGVPADGDAVSLYKGLFEETWPTTRAEAIALAHIDCDWYDPVKYCLAACADKLAGGGLIIIDDYNDYGGCKTAVDEFLRERGDFFMEPGVNPFLGRRAS